MRLGVSLGIPMRRGPVYGPQLVTNGSFDTDLTGWTIGSDVAQVIPTWTAGGKVTLVRGAGSNAGFSQVISPAPVIGQRFLLEYDVESGTMAGISYGFAVAIGLTGIGSTILTASDPWATFQLWPQSTGATVVLRSISLRRIL